MALGLLLNMALALKVQERIHSQFMYTALRRNPSFALTMIAQLVDRSQTADVTFQQA